jgi:hypothetical protein
MATAMKTIIAVAGLGGLLGSAALFASKPSDVGETAARDTRPSWTEIGWPFPIDQWGSGKAFNCKPSNCGAEINLYVRAKIGFCNCATGVADDEELERVGDLPLVGSPPYSAAGPGRPLAARMQGRTRPYLITGSFGSPKSALAVALNDRCDVIVATAIVNGGLPISAEDAVIRFLNSDVIARWADMALGL